MPNLLDLIHSSELLKSTSNIEGLKEQIPLNKELTGLFEEIDLAADIVYFSETVIKHSVHGIRVSNVQKLLLKLLNRLRLDIQELSVGFSETMFLTGESYNRYVDFKKNLTDINSRLHKISADELYVLLISDLDISNSETDERVKQVFELLDIIIRNLSLHLASFYNTIDELISDYCGVEISDTNLKDEANQGPDSFALKFNVYTRCIDAILKKYVSVSTAAVEKLEKNVGTWLGIEEASKQLAQLEKDLRHKWPDRFNQ